MQGIPEIGPFKKRAQEIDAAMALPDFFSDQRKAARLSREHQKLTLLIETYEHLKKISQNIEENEEMASDTSLDEELRTLARSEIEDLKKQREDLEQRVLQSMIPPEESDGRNIVLEIRAGTGGDEASLFAAELYRLYCRYAERQSWKAETLSSSPSECGGFKEVSMLISGEEVYKRMKYESGVHRVQRVPATEANGRIHTSTATVAVLPEAEEVDIAIKPDELEITVCRASGPGGQGVNTTDSAVQIVHKPTGTIVTCADERSQQKNRVKAMTILRSRLLKAREEEERAKYAAARKSQIGTGDRSERIRTYNFPQNRLTDHRVGITLYNLPDVMEGHIDEILDGLQKIDMQEKIQALLEQK
ncbi:MAG: peptide chain release factor 1 [Verrucomicrobia bacterium GWC2_42_7]|nr:MAG: peptide chain release factor 1 [Verrucomicrobia bacterium GWC2_42_7]